MESLTSAACAARDSFFLCDDYDIQHSGPSTSVPTPVPPITDNNSHTKTNNYRPYDSHFLKAFPNPPPPPPAPVYVDKRQCSLCLEWVETFQILPHTGRCYMITCLKRGFLPNCPCARCLVSRTHPGDYLLNGNYCYEDEACPRGSFANPVAVESESLDSDCEDAEINGFPVHELIDSFLTSAQLQGNGCVFCPKTKRSQASSGIPTIFIGEYRKLSLCKKLHLTNRDDQQKLLEVITQQLEIVRSGKDDFHDVLMYGSPRGENIQEQKRCVGYYVDNKIDGERLTAKCGFDCDGLLQTRIGDKVYHFCQATHLLRWIGKYYLHQGKTITKDAPVTTEEESANEEDDVQEVADEESVADEEANVSEEEDPPPVLKRKAESRPRSKTAGTKPSTKRLKPTTSTKTTTKSKSITRLSTGSTKSAKESKLTQPTHKSTKPTIKSSAKPSTTTKPTTKSNSKSPAKAPTPLPTRSKSTRNITPIANLSM